MNVLNAVKSGFCLCSDFMQAPQRSRKELVTKWLVCLKRSFKALVVVVNTVIMSRGENETTHVTVKTERLKTLTDLKSAVVTHKQGLEILIFA